MWQKLARFVIRNRFFLLMLLLLTTAGMGYFASQVKLSYDFAKAIPKDNEKLIEYNEFKKHFGEDGNMMVIGVENRNFFEMNHFKAYQSLQHLIKNVRCVEDVLAVPSAIVLQRDSMSEKLLPHKIFREDYTRQEQLDSAAAVFKNIPFYNSMLYNNSTSAYLMAVRINKDSLNSPARVRIVKDIKLALMGYERQFGKVQTHISGLPLIRTVVAERIQKEMKFFLQGSLLLSIIILMILFRSVSTTIISMSVVLIGVVWTFGLIYLCGYKITLLTALIPSLVVVIGIPNCIYFINKYHYNYVNSTDTSEEHRKYNALVDMVSKMGVVTLFCNITAAIGFGVFFATSSAILKEFGVVAGISIMLIFMVSFILLPAVLSYLPSPKKTELKYLSSQWIAVFLNKVETWVFNHRKAIQLTTAMVLVFSVAGILRLKTVAFIVDDLPKKDKIYTDLKFFESNFHGIMPLEIQVDAKKRRGIRQKGISIFNKIDSLSAYISSRPEMNRPLSVSEGLKFATMAFNDNDSAQYRMPTMEEAAFIKDNLMSKNNQNSNSASKLLNSFIDTSSRYTRISVSMADVGTEKLPGLLDSVQQKANQYFDTASYKVTLTGTSITFLEGSKYIINGLKESIFWAFLLIAICMLYLFRSFRILLCSLLPNLIPLVVTAGIMGWTGVPLKPSTVLVFSVALGIAIDITIRFLVNYRQVLPHMKGNVALAVKGTVHQTGLSIIYTSLVLVAGFIIFCGSSFGGTFALGWLTSLTLLTATLTNIIVLPVLLLIFFPEAKK
jgi:predicted RND superfamily exporter protein